MNESYKIKAPKESHGQIQVILGIEKMKREFAAMSYEQQLEFARKFPDFIKEDVSEINEQSK